ncbi:MAG: hypothetical protein M0R74_09010, partial [Dehalococcoidia bacterium]|nr:hypothetical protein [Dehalococcoidia bacterium]
PDGRCAYTVTETQQAGWTAAGSLERRVSSAKPGVTTVLFYTNIRVEEPTPTVTPTETPTEPTETVTTTPTDTPDVTSTVEPQEPSSPSPSPTETPIDDVEGDRTPGAPSTGSGLFGDSAGSFNLLLALAGLASLSVGFGLFALRTRRND